MLIGLAALCALVLVLLVVLLVKLSHTRRELLSLRREMGEELRSNLHDAHDSLVQTFSGITQAWSEQVNAVLKQNYSFEQMNEQHRTSMERMTADHLSRMTQQMEVQRNQLEDRLSSLEKKQAQSLEEIRQTVDEKLNEKLEKQLNESFALVCERLEEVYRSLGEVHTLVGGVNDLKKVLSGVKTRGIWGEAQLGALLAETLTGSQYQTNVMVVPSSGERVEYAVRLPGKAFEDEPVYLPIDSKFPLEDYARLAQASQAGDAKAAEEARKALLNSVKVEARRIGKYIAPPYSTDFAVMFLPLESLYAEVMCHTEAVEGIRRDYHIMIAGPSTLQALLNSLQMGFRTLAIEERSAQVWRLLGAVKGDFHNYALLLQKTQEKLRQASDSVDTAFTKTRSIEKRLKDVENVDGYVVSELLPDEGSGTEGDVSR